MKLTDICVNLSNNQFKADRADVLSRAIESGVTRLLVVGTDVASSEFCAEWATKHDPLFATAGVHPHDADQVAENWLEAIRVLAAKECVVAIGETGLDFNRTFSSRANQIACFEAQIALAQELTMPLFVHDRESGGLVLEMLQSVRTEIGVVVHCFTGTTDELDSYLDAGFFIGITGWIADTRRGQALRDMVKKIPLAQLLIETDAPFLRPHSVPTDWLAQHRLDASYKRRSEPAMLPYVLEAIAAQRPESIAEIASATHDNASRLFNLPSF